MNRVIIITTTDLQDRKIESGKKRIILIKYGKFKKFIKNQKDKKDLLYIRNTSININNSYKEAKRQKILNFVYNNYKKHGEKLGYYEISKALGLHIYTYFDSLMDIYKILKIPPPLKNMGGLRAKNPDKECINLWKNEFKKYILEKMKKTNKYPSGEEIGKHFGISHIWNVVKVSDLYKELGLKSYLEREKRVTFSPEA